MQLNLPQEQLEELVTKAIVEMMTPEARDELIKQSIQSLLAKDFPGSNPYDKKTYLRDLFEDAARNVARKVAMQNLEEDPEFLLKLDGLFKDAVSVAFENENREKMVNKMANAIIQGMGMDRY